MLRGLLIGCHIPCSLCSPACLCLTYSLFFLLLGAAQSKAAKDTKTTARIGADTT